MKREEKEATENGKSHLSLEEEDERGCGWEWRPGLPRDPVFVGGRGGRGERGR